MGNTAPNAASNAPNAPAGAAAPAGTGQAPGAPGAATPPAAPASWDEWLTAAPPEIQAMASQHVAGLKSALESERAEKKAFAKQLADAAKLAADGSEAKKQLEEMSARLADAERQTTFMESATKAGIIPGSIKLAYMAAQADGLIGAKGQVDFAALRETYPNLFASEPAKAPAAPPARVGGQPGGHATLDMNAQIRRAAGHG